MPAATQTLLDDAVVDIDAWLADEVETAFAEQESTAFVTGNGVSRPRGFLSLRHSWRTAAWVPGKLGTVATGVAGAFAAANPSDVLFDLVYALRAGYRQNATFVMNRQPAEHDPQVQGRGRQLPVAAARSPPTAPRP